MAHDTVRQKKEADQGEAERGRAYRLQQCRVSIFVGKKRRRDFNFEKKQKAADDRAKLE